MHGLARAVVRLGVGAAVGVLGLAWLAPQPAIGQAAGAVAAETVEVPARPAVASPAEEPVVPVLLPAAPEGPPPRTQPSVVRRRDPPDHYLRPPDVPRGAFTLAATGDLLIHTPVRTRAAQPGGGFDFHPQLANVAPLLAAADVGLCHLEVPLDPDGPYSSYPIFNAPAELAPAIKDSGWDLCSTASNHSADRGMEGVVLTLDALDAAGVEHRGTYRTRFEALRPRLFQVGDTPVGFVSATYGLNGLPAPGGNEWSVRRIDPVEGLLQAARQLREAGAEVVVASLHWGEEYQHSPTGYQRDVASALLSGGEIDAIVGHHAHVVQPVEWINDRPVVFGLGNFLSGQKPTERRDGAIATLSFVEDPDGWWVDAVTAQPTWVDDGYAVIPAHPDDAYPLGPSAQRTLATMGVPMTPAREAEP